MKLMSDAPVVSVRRGCSPSPRPSPSGRGRILGSEIRALGVRRAARDRADVFRKGPGQPAFAKVADDIITKFYDATGLAAGLHEFKVVPRNSKGDGPESAVSGVTVG